MANEPFSQTDHVMLQQQIQNLQDQLTQMQREQNDQNSQEQDHNKRNSRTRSRRRHDNEPNRHRNNSDTSSDDQIDLSRIIKFDTTPLSMEFTYSNWIEWISHLEQFFLAAPKKFQHDRAKVLFATNYMDATCRTVFRIYCSDATDDVRTKVENDWSTFVDWSKTQIRQSAHLTASISRQLEAARQKEGQHPREFHTYLATIEHQEVQKSPQEKAMLFYRKLLRPLQMEIMNFENPLPRTRQDMVDAASKRWDMMTKSQKYPKTFKSERSNRPKSDSKNGRNNQKQKNQQRERSRSNSPHRQSQNPKDNNSNNSRNRSDKPRKPLNEVVCYKCNNKGHYANKCPQKSPHPEKRGIGEVQAATLSPEPKRPRHTGKA